MKIFLKICFYIPQKNCRYVLISSTNRTCNLASFVFVSQFNMQNIQVGTFVKVKTHLSFFCYFFSGLKWNFESRAFIYNRVFFVYFKLPFFFIFYSSDMEGFIDLFKPSISWAVLLLFRMLEKIYISRFSYHLT